MTPNTIFIDCETTGLNPFKDTIRCVAWQVNDGPILCFKPTDEHELGVFQSQMFATEYVCGHNIGFDIKFLYQAGIIKTIPKNFIDTKLLYHSLNPHESLKLKDLAEKYLGVSAIRLKDLQTVGQGKKKKKLSFAEIPIEDLMDYCKSDVFYSYELYKRYLEQERPQELTGAKK